MTIYITKEVDIELEEDEVLGEIDESVLLEAVIDSCSASRILNQLDQGDIVAHIANDKQTLAALLRAVADQLNYQ